MARVKEQPISPLENLTDRSADEGLQALRQRQATLHANIEVERQRLANLEEKLAEARRVSHLDRFADALLGDPDASLTQIQSLQGEHTLAVQRLSGLNRAVQLGAKEIEDYEAELDAIDCRTVAPLHRQNVRGVVNAMLHLHREIVQQLDLYRALQARGVQRTSHLRGFNHGDFEIGLVDPSSWLSFQLRELVEFKFISEDERVSLLQGRATELDIEA